MIRKNLAGALHNDGSGCTLSLGWEVKMEIPFKVSVVVLLRTLAANWE